MQGDPQNPLDWLTIARRDLAQAPKNASDHALPYAVFWCQQAAKKALKAWLISQGWPLLKTHHLSQLLNEAIARGMNLDWFDRAAVRLTDLYLSERYVVPADEEDPPPSLEETRELLDGVEKLIATLFPQSHP